eukprot:TRINITY_DN1939_c0_g1_i1.p1 TRINITY_DN1939_c0_g1~~TRINITY_DN1939_c0_g1_i1.p1  ORF type:complete len:298 (-),score=53.24 TRINITY_DN1939_c0_g1_i1:39-932(-)
MNPLGGASGIQTIEVRLAGSIEKAQEAALLSRLKAVAYPAPTPCKYHEMVYRYVYGLSKAETIELRVRCDLTSTPRRWTVHEYGAERLYREDNKRGITARSVVDVNVGSNIGAFLTAVGFTFEFEFVREGTSFHSRKGVTATVTNLLKVTRQSMFPIIRVAKHVNHSFTHSNAQVLERDKPEKTEFVDPNRIIVELIARATEEKRAVDEVASFSESLLPVADLSNLYSRVIKPPSLPPAHPPQHPAPHPQHVQPKVAAGVAPPTHLPSHQPKPTTNPPQHPPSHPPPPSTQQHPIVL